MKSLNFKLIAFVLSLAMLVSIVPMNVIASEAIPNDASRMIIEDKTVAKGETFTLNVLLENAPAIKSFMIVDIEYDTSTLELVSGELCVEGAVFSDWNNAEKVATVMFESNTDANGAVLRLTFKVLENATLGEYDINFTTVVKVKNEGEAEREIEVYDIPGTVTVAEITASSSIDYADMALGTDITVNYYATLDPAHIGAQMRFTFNGDEFTVDGIATEENENEYVYAFKGIPPQCMGDNIKAELIFNGEVIASKDTYSVRQYCNNILAKNAQSLNISEEKFAALQTLIADMLEYGACAQTYRGYKTDDLVNSGITGQTEFVEIEEDLEYIEESQVEEIQMISAGMYFDYVNSLFLKFTTLPNLTDENCYVIITNEVTEDEIEYPLSACTLWDESTYTYLLISNPIFVTEYQDNLTIELYGPNSRGKIRCLQTLEYSISSYIYSMQNKTDGSGKLTPMACLARATYNYALSATAYNDIAE